MTAPGGRNNDWEEDTLVGPGPVTVRMPTSRPPPPAASGVFEVMPNRRGFLEPDGSFWPADDLPVPGEIHGGPAYKGA